MSRSPRDSPSGAQWPLRAPGVVRTLREAVTAVCLCRDGRSRAPSEAAFIQYRRLDFICEKPVELDAPLLGVLFLQDFFGASELFIASHLICGGPEVL